MELLLQTLIVAALVAGSAVFAAWKLMPARTKLRALDAMGPSTSTATGRWLSRLRSGVLEELTHGCGSCSKNSEHVKKHAPKVTS